MTDSLYVRNMAILTKRFPGVADRLTKLPDDITIEGEPTPEYPACIIRSTEGRSLRVCSVRPEVEARRWLEGQGLMPDDNVVLLGLGVGYSLLELFRNSDRRDVIVVVEKSPTFLRLALRLLDLTGSLSSPKLRLFLDDESAVIAKTLRPAIQSLAVKNLVCITHPVCESLYPAYYKAIADAIIDFYQWMRANINTLSNSGWSMTRNTIRNLLPFAAAPGGGGLFGKFRDVLGVIVAAGPSLDKNLIYLRALKGWAVIIAVDTIYAHLLCEGIIPDIVVSIDYTLHTRRYFEEIDPSHNTTALMFDPEVNPEVLRLHRGPMFAIDLESKPVLDWARPFMGTKGVLTKGLSVSHTALSLARAMGCEPIVLVGMDMAHAGGGETHAAGISAGTFNADSGSQPVRGINQTSVRTTAALAVYLRHLEGMLDEPDRRTVIDATEGGARIADTEIMTLREVVGRYGYEPELDIYGVLLAVHQAAEECRWSDIIPEIELMRKTVINIRETIDQTQQLTGGDSGDRADSAALKRRLRRLTRDGGLTRQALKMIEYNIGGELIKSISGKSNDQGLFKAVQESAVFIENELSSLLNGGVVTGGYNDQS